MNIKRAIGIIFVLFIVIHAITVIESKLLGINLETQDPKIMPLTMWYVTLISAFIFSALGAMWFFRFREKPNAKNGFLFGIAVSMFGFIADIILFARLKSGLNILLKYYIQPWYWIIFILILAACTLVGYIKSKEVNIKS